MKGFMTLQDKLTQDMREAMKTRDSARLSTIRFALSEIRNVEIDNGPQTDEQVQEILRRQIKQMREAIEQFTQGDRADLVAEEQAKIATLEVYLPQQLEAGEVEAVVQNIFAQATEPVFAKVMPVAMQQLKGKADGKLVAEIVRRLTS